LTAPIAASKFAASFAAVAAAMPVGVVVMFVPVLLNVMFVPAVVFVTVTTAPVALALALVFAAVTPEKHGVAEPQRLELSLIAAARFAAAIVVVNAGIVPPVGDSVTAPEVVVNVSEVAFVFVIVSTAPAFDALIPVCVPESLAKHGLNPPAQSLAKF
jgi:hypothetical protein